MSYQTGRNFVGESQNTLDISSRRHLPGRGWVYAAYCRSCHQHQTFSHATLASGNGAICRYCSVSQARTETLADVRRAERNREIAEEAERARSAVAAKRDLDKRIAERAAEDEIRRDFVRYGNHQIARDVPLDRLISWEQWKRSGDSWREQILEIVRKDELCQ